MNIWPFLVVAAGVGFIAGVSVMAWACAYKLTYTAWEVTTLNGEKRTFFDREEAGEYMAAAGICAVRKLKVLV